jgi:hypothetical protein
MNSSISYSMFVDDNIKNKTSLRRRNITNYIDKLLPRSMHKWVDDNSVTKCYKCNKTFSLIYRRHHCRACGRIFCSNCSTNIIKAERRDEPCYLINRDRYIYNSHHKHYNVKCYKYRACDKCFNTFNNISNLSDIIILIKNLPLSLKDMCVLFLNKKWTDAMIIYLSIFREIQYNLTNHVYTSCEKKLLLNNYYYLSGHNKLIVQFFKSLDYDKLTDNEVKKYIKHINTGKKCSCWNLMCVRNCCKNIQSEDIIEIISFKNNYYLKRYFLKFFDNISEYEFLALLPCMVYYLTLDGLNKNITFMYLVSRALKSDKIRLYLYFELFILSNLDKKKYCIFYKKIFNQYKKIIIAKLGYDSVNNLINIINISSKLSYIPNDKYKFKNLFRNELENKSIPLDPNIHVNQVLVNAIEYKNSKTKPLMIPCACVYKNNRFKEFEYNILIKNDNLMKDKIVISVIRIMDLIIKKELKLDLNITTYDVLPINIETGFIEMVDKSTTIYDIKEKLKTSLQNFILSNNDKKPIGIIKNNFIKSTAAYCTITYLLGIGDRHLENILIKNDGTLFHIDYDYILGSDCKPLVPFIRIIPDMVDTIGGINSDNYKLFRTLCGKCYNCLRKHTNLFTHMLYPLSRVDYKLSKFVITNEIFKRFIPGENCPKANIHLTNKIDSSTNSFNFIDSVHYYYKEYSLKKTVKTIVTTTISKIKGYIW